MADKPVTAQQMKLYLAALGVETAIDFDSQRLYVVHVDVKYPEIAQRVLEGPRVLSNPH